MTRRAGLWLLGIFGVAALVVGVVMWRVGLDRADQIGSVVGAICAVVGLGVSVFSAVVAVRALRADSKSDRAGAVHPRTVRNTVKDSTIDGPNIQVGSVGGDATFEVDK
jgi:hypothetical protein